jgi:acyl-CoA dehydrogenase
MHRQVEVARTYTRAVAARHVRRRGRRRRGLPGEADRGRRRRTSATRPSSCTAARATCTGPRWSGTYRDARILPIGGGATEVLTGPGATAVGISS